MRRTLPFLQLIALLVLTWALNRPFGTIPAIGAFLDPLNGVWRNAETKAPPTRLVLTDGMSQPVTVIFDEHGIPHIYAETEADLYRAQGFVMARDRLFQMDFSTRAAAGRLSEVLGARAIGFDKNQRRIGMGIGAERFLDALAKDAAYMAAVESYAAGVNAHIATLKPHQYPLEYKLLGFAPEPWSPLKTAYMVMNLNKTLSFGTSAVGLSNTRKLLGAEFVDRMYPYIPVQVEPIIPAGTRWDFEPVAVPEAPAPDPMSQYSDTRIPESNPDIGSNNWAVHGSKTATGKPILVNDPHLDLTLPSIWYLLQLSTPDFTAKGVGFPGVPDVVLGFNEHIAWGATNVGNSAVDIYAITTRDGNREYLHDGVWKPTTLRIEEIPVNGAATVVDTVFITHQGPITEAGTAMRWTGLHIEEPFKTFYLLNRARNYEDYKASLAYFDNPPQNLVYADREGTIALHLAGRFPLKWRGQGREVADGTDPRYDWAGWIPKSHNPFVANPSRGFVSSANQHSTDAGYPYYLEWDFAPVNRGRVINDELSRMSGITPHDMRRLQMNTRSYFAEMVLDTLLARLDAGALSGAHRQAFDTLLAWNKRNDRESGGPTLFNRWWSAIHASIWNAHFPERGRYKKPSDQNTIQLILDDPDHAWLNTGKPLNAHIRDAFTTTVDALDEDWAWWRHLNGRADHLLGIPSLGSGVLYASGDKNSVLALNGANGPSWRLVAEMGDSAVVAMGIYPGGQSGNPGSPRYNNFTADWAEGRLYPLPIRRKD